MLTWIIGALNNARGFKYFVVGVNTLDSGVNGLNRLGVMNVTANKVTEFYEIVYSANYLSRDMALYGR